MKARIAIDLRGLDRLSLCNGQYRYATDLVRGLAELQVAPQFVVLGSQPAPVAEIASVFRDREHWEYHCVPQLAGRGALYREQFRCRRLLRRLRVDIFHALHSFVPMFPPFAVVATVYDLMPELFPEYAAIVRSREYRQHRWAFQHFVSRAIAISKTTAHDLHRLWSYPREQTEVVYLGPELPMVAAAKQSNDVPVILSPYNLEPRKNLLKLLDAMARLRSQGWRFQLVLFGRAAVNEAREREFHDRLDKLELRTSTTLTGSISDTQLAELYGTASVFVFPSLYEGFGLPVLEAMSAGTCVVAHDDSAMAEVVAGAGVLIDMRSVEAICDGVMKAIRSPELGALGTRRASSFSRRRMASETFAVYEKALAETAGRIPRRSFGEADGALPSHTAEGAGAD